MLDEVDIGVEYPGRGGYVAEGVELVKVVDREVKKKKEQAVI